MRPRKIASSKKRYRFSNLFNLAKTFKIKTFILYLFFFLLLSTLVVIIYQVLVFNTYISKKDDSEKNFLPRFNKLLRRKPRNMDLKEINIKDVGDFDDDDIKETSSNDLYFMAKRPFKKHLREIYDQFENECIENQHKKVLQMDLLTEQNKRNISLMGRPIFSQEEREISLKFSQCLELFNEKVLKSIDLKFLFDGSSNEFSALHEPEMIYTILSHNRFETFNRSLIDGWINVESINKTLVIVSQDGYFENIYTLLKKVSFQIPLLILFNDRSCQDVRDMFPAESSNDCQELTKLEDQKRLKCTGNADVNGHFRRQALTSLKHHQMQMVNRLYRQQIPKIMSETKNDIQAFVFEEDHFVSPKLHDHLLRLAILSPDICPYCVGINVKSNRFGNPHAFENIQRMLNKLTDEKGQNISQTNDFYSTMMRNMGQGQSQKNWQTYMKNAICKSGFCKWNEYNWDQTFYSTVDCGFFISHSNYVVEHMPSCTGLHHFIDCTDKSKEKIWTEQKSKILKLMKENYKPLDIDMILQTILENQRDRNIKIINPPFKSINKAWSLTGQGAQSDKRDLSLCQSLCN